MKNITSRSTLTIMSILIVLFAVATMEALSVEANKYLPLVAADSEPLTWSHLSTETGDLDPPSASTQQTASLILDIDKDGVEDFVIGARSGAPALVWYKRQTDGWQRYVIDSEFVDIEAGGAHHDIDQDGDLDIVMGGDYRSNQVWWWENPYPNYDPGTNWTRRLIKNSGSNKHHDQMFGDFDGDGQTELVFWNQDAGTLFLAEIPDNPRTSGTWPLQTIYSWTGTEHEGFAQADIDLDGLVDIVGGGRWFKYNGGSSYSANIIDSNQTFSRAAAGQLKPGGRPEVVFVVGDGVGRLKWYEWNGSSWVGTDLLGFDVDHGHSLQIEDVNGDGYLDIFVAEMRLDGGNADAKMWILLGDGSGNFTTTEVATGYGNHESKLGDLDGDGDWDILGKPYNWDAPRLDIWLNESGGSCVLSLDDWDRHLIDASKPARSIFIYPADLNGDGFQDVVTGGWWYENPGTPSGTWSRKTIGSPLNNVAAVYDFDKDGDLDILGTEGVAAASNSNFVWARNNGSGVFTILDNIDQGEGDFLQGVAVDQFVDGNDEVALSWHQGNMGVQMLDVPDDPVNNSWTWGRISTTSQDEALSSADIDRDGDRDLLLGTKWLRNDATTNTTSGPWSVHDLFGGSGDPDRNRLADMNNDGRLDAVVGYEAISLPGKLAWYEQPGTATDLWSEHIIDDAVTGPMSLDVADMDGDGDSDVVAGEHNLSNPAAARVLVYENPGSGTGAWTAHVIYTGDEHHDGTQLVDIDNDGDLDVISIGWSHDRVLLYENLSCTGGGPAPTPTSTPDPGATNTPVPTATPPATSGSRVTQDLVALYRFEEGAGTTVSDVSNVGSPLNLSISGSTSWLPAGGLAINGNSSIASSGAAGKVIDAAQASSELTLEVWIKPANITQEGPARIVSISQDPYTRNLTLGQGLWGDQPSDVFDLRLRTTGTNLDGKPSLTTAAGSASTQLQQLVFSFGSGQRHIYKDGALIAGEALGGDLSNWDDGYPLILANEATGDRPWLGELHLVAFYKRALSAAEVDQNFQAGAHPDDVLQQEIVLSTSWNMISSYLQPENPDLAVVMADVVEDLVLMKNGAGEVYWPDLGLNSIGSWQVAEGYQVFMENPAPLTIHGSRVDPAAMAIDLAEGWSLFSYLQDHALPVEQALESISEELQLVKNNDGEVYWPAFGVDQIGSLQPGQGYNVNLTQPATLIYPISE